MTGSIHPTRRLTDPRLPWRLSQTGDRIHYLISKPPYDRLGRAACGRHSEYLYVPNYPGRPCTPCLRSLHLFVPDPSHTLATLTPLHAAPPAPISASPAPTHRL